MKISPVRDMEPSWHKRKIGKRPGCSFYQSLYGYVFKVLPYANKNSTMVDSHLIDFHIAGEICIDWCDKNSKHIRESGSVVEIDELWIETATNLFHKLCLRIENDPSDYTISKSFVESLSAEIPDLLPGLRQLNQLRDRPKSW
ncbi:hypothetical protein RF11_07098 [Thelohanellus kitauei]|uniref:Uncharacterized protein n=1 Tax=Thelohanellus kitauei TaxID=669202 RepID=A0A0C2IA75_THEKT|nr:hypothetical protein RF11_07098 [Thelohanellus kitauei]